MIIMIAFLAFLLLVLLIRLYNIRSQAQETNGGIIPSIHLQSNTVKSA